MADQLTLRELRFNAGLTPEALGAVIHISGRTVRRLEDGDKPTPRVAKKVADYFKVKPTEIWPVEDREEAKA